MLKSNRSVFVEFHISVDNGSWRILLKAFTMYGCGGHLGHLHKLSFPYLKESPYEFFSSIGLMVSAEMFEKLDGRRMDAGVIGILLARPW